MFWPGHTGGRGYTSEALAAVIRHGFEVMRLERVEAFHILENPASGRVMEKAGMAFEGVLRSYLKVDDTYRDTKVYSITRADWSGRC